MEFRKFTHDAEFHKIVNNKKTLRAATKKFLNNIIDEITLGIIFDTHRKFKTNALDLLEYEAPKQDGGQFFAPSVDIYARINRDKESTEYCECPNCNKTVIAKLFAAHLEICMGLVRNRFRSSGRIRQATEKKTEEVAEKKTEVVTEKKTEVVIEKRTEVVAYKKKEVVEPLILRIPKAAAPRSTVPKSKKKERSKVPKSKKERSRLRQEKKDKKLQKEKKHKKSKRRLREEVWNLDDKLAELNRLETKYYNFEPDFEYDETER